MRVTVPEAAALLNATEVKVRAWIESGDLPAQRIQNHYRINRSELLEWATGRNIAVAPALFLEDEDAGRPLPSVADSLARGGVFHDVRGTTPEEILRSVVAVLKLEDERDRETLLEIFLARGAGAVVPVGDGIAIPHVRNPIALATDEALALFFLAHPADFAAPDGLDVFALFVLVSPTTRAHLRMLAKIAFVLRDPGFGESVRRRATAAELVAAARRAEDRRA
jgi:PTS system nitrogen regulatory IIA component